VVRVAAPEDTKQTEDEVMAAAYGLKLVKRNRCVRCARRAHFKVLFDVGSTA